MQRHQCIDGVTSTEIQCFRCVLDCSASAADCHDHYPTYCMSTRFASADTNPPADIRQNNHSLAGFPHHAYQAPLEHGLQTALQHAAAVLAARPVDMRAMLASCCAAAHQLERADDSLLHTRQATLATGQ